MSFEDITRILQSCHLPETVEITLESRLREDLMLSSFQMMVLVVKLEEELCLEIDPTMLIDSATVQQLLSSINTLKESH